MNRSLPMLVLFVAVSTAQVSKATSISVPNHSFEAQVLADGAFLNNPADNFSSIPNWVYMHPNFPDFNQVPGFPQSGSFQVVNPNNNHLTGSLGNVLPGTGDGANVAFPTITFGYLRPALAPTVVGAEGDEFTLTVAVGHSKILTSLPNGAIHLTVGGNGVSHRVASRTFGSVDVPLDSVVDITLSYTSTLADVGRPLSLQLEDPSPSDFWYDNVRLDVVEAVPEPAPLALASLLACIALGTRRLVLHA